MDHQPRPGIPAKKKRRDRLIQTVMGHPDWAVGFEDEVWWSRFAQPRVHTWTEDDQALHLVEQVKAKTDPDPKALACYGLLLRWWPLTEPAQEKALLRFVDGRPVSAHSMQYLEWACQQIAVIGLKVLVLVWDNASWHISHSVRTWVRAHNRHVKQSRAGIRILLCYLPIQSPWLNPIEPKWMHGKRKVLESDRTLSAQEVAERVCAVFDCVHEPHFVLPNPENVS
jgi:DDE superfamily endonuclease